MKIKAILLFLMLMAGCLLPVQAAEVINAIVAVVNEEPITRLEVEQEARRLININSDIEEDGALQTALNELIDRRIQLQLARRLNIVISDEEVERRLQTLQQEFGLTGEAALKGAARDRFLMSYPEFRARVREDMQIQTLFYRQVFSRAQAYEDEVEQFLKSQAKIGNVREYHLRHILITVAADGSDLEEKQDLVLSLRASITAGADFSALAVQYSDDDTAAIGGNIGFRKETQLPEAFLIEVQNLNPGDISAPISTSRGFHLLKLEVARGGDIRRQIKRFLISHVFLPAEEQAKAEEIRERIKSEDDFISAVREYSVDEVSVDKQGEIGWFHEEDVPPYFADAVAQMQAGDISVPVKSPFGWHILYLRDVQIEGVNVQALRDQARRILRERRALAQRDIWLRRLRGDAHVRILDVSFEYNAQ